MGSKDSAYFKKADFLLKSIKEEADRGSSNTGQRGKGVLKDGSLTNR